jgi:hypothetical protein
MLHCKENRRTIAEAHLEQEEEDEGQSVQATEPLVVLVRVTGSCSKR